MKLGRLRMDLNEQQRNLNEYSLLLVADFGNNPGRCTSECVRIEWHFSPPSRVSGSVLHSLDSN